MEVSRWHWVVVQLAEPHPCLPGGLQPGSCHSPALQAQAARAHPSQQGLHGAPAGPRGWLWARGVAASHCMPGPKLQLVCAQPLSISDPYGLRGQGGQNQPSHCFVSQ